jgi:hypothetical protein
MLALMASLLDPCMKGGVGISPEDQDTINGKIRNQMGMIAREGIAIEGEAVVLEGNNEIHGEQEQEPARQNQDDLDIFDEIHQFYLDHHHLEEQGDHNQRDHIMEDIIDAELTLYRQEAPIPMKDNSGNYTNPLFWWSLNERKFKHLSILESRIFCVSRQLLLPPSAYFIQQDSPLPKTGPVWHLTQQMNYFFYMMFFLALKGSSKVQEMNRFWRFLRWISINNPLNTCLLPVGILPSHEPPPSGEDVVGCSSYYTLILIISY